ncbi:MAG: RAMP superfamily CRISPR-associated protein [Cyanophyceae cyanobacterium]
MSHHQGMADKVPLMFQAQTEGRCQLQYAASEDAQRWASEWIEKAESYPRQWSGIQSRTYTLSWRFVTNGGQDDGIIRPVIGAFGLPYYPGSSMKGAFREACQQLHPEKVDDYCGNAEKPGILRFHGGYPTDDRWQENLVDVVHPQQGWQVKTNDTSNKPRGESAFALISLYKPEFEFGISSTSSLEAAEWKTIWDIWELAISVGLGCRVSAGYGQPKQQKRDILYRAHLIGQGLASTLLDGESEFRPNIFKATLRGHALRIFGGLTDAATAEKLVETLFGGVTERATVGLLAMNWNEFSLALKPFDEGYGEPTYAVEGVLRWFLTQSLPSEERKALQKLVKNLTSFAMLLGGFGKSWRRADHRLFYPEYYEDKEIKPLIGCHWQWGKRSQIPYNVVRQLATVGDFIDNVRDSAQEWMQCQGLTSTPNNYANWREAWHPNQVQVWGREADSAEDSEAIDWFHGPYQKAYRDLGIAEGSIYHTAITGRVNQISRLWNRMYPKIRFVKDPATPKKPMARPTNFFFELLTIFPDSSPRSRQFLDFLASEMTTFQRLW